MRCHDAKRGLSAQCGAHVAPPAERAEDVRADSCEQEQPASLLGTPSSQLYPCISTERIMHAVEHQRRITQQLDDLRAQQRQRTAFLRVTGLRVMAWSGLALGILVGALVLLCLLQPAILASTVRLLSGFIAFMLAVGESLQASLSLIPSNSWVLSAVALAVVLMMALWLHLMRYPREV